MRSKGLFLRGEKDSLIELEIDGILDLHAFSPKDVPDLIDHYIRLCIEKGIYEIKIIHGKGKGILRKRVHSLLKKNGNVLEFHLSDDQSSWGATIVYLKKEKIPPQDKS